MAKKHSKASLKKLSLDALRQIMLEQYGAVPEDDMEEDALIEIILFEQKSAQKSDDDDDGVGTVIPVAGKDELEIYFPASEGPGGESPIFFGHNGRQFLAHRNKWMKIPRSVLSAISDATKTEFSRNEADELVGRDVPTYHYQVREILIK